MHQKKERKEIEKNFNNENTKREKHVKKKITSYQSKEKPGIEPGINENPQHHC
jgi:hypothetical protein